MRGKNGPVVASTLVAVVVGGALPGCGSEDQTPRRIGEATDEVQSPQVPIAGGTIPQFVQALPLPSTTTGGIHAVLGNRKLTIRMCEFWAKVLPEGTFSPGVQPKTRVWGYIVGDACPPNGPDAPALDTYIGPAIVNERGSATPITWINDLGDAATTAVLAYRFSTDQTLHWADPLNAERDACSDAANAGVVPPFGSFCAQNYAGPIPAVAHLHGGEVPAELDGGPEQWFTSDRRLRGPAYHSFHGAPKNGAIFNYPNVQQAAPIWFHDHTLGATRLNVHSGLAGVYLIEDPSIVPRTATTTAGTQGRCEHDCLPANLPPLAAAIPLVLQDRVFDTNGQLFFPADSAGGVLSNPTPQHPYWVPEFIGDTIVVNGRAWPFVEVEAKRQQFVLLNGSNARAYQLTIPGGPLMYVIATDGGYLDRPVAVSTLLMQPGERYEVIIDFAGFTGRQLLLENAANTPLPDGDPVDPTTTARIVQFRVGAPPAGGDASYDPAAVPVVPLRTGNNAIVRLVDPDTGTLAPDVRVDKTRQLTLNEVLASPSTAIDPVTGVLTDFPGGPLRVLVNNTPYAGVDRPDFTPIQIGKDGRKVTKFYSELPREGSTEVWEVVNMTADAHPIHLHLVQFQLMNRQDFDPVAYPSAYDAAFPGGVYIPAFGPPLQYDPSPASGGTFGGNPDVTPFLSGPVTPPASYEAGWKDTVIMPPNQVTRIAVRWAPTTFPTTTRPADLHFPFDPSNERGYVWHCHIVDHEDNDMMRPDLIEANPLVKHKDRSLFRARDY